LLIASDCTPKVGSSQDKKTNNLLAIGYHADQKVMNSSTIGIFVAIFGLLCLVGIIVASRLGAKRVAPTSNFAKRHDELLRLLRERPSGARYYLSLEDGSAWRWREVFSSKPNELHTDDDKPISLNIARAFIVTYASGEVLATSIPQPSPAKLPEGTFFARPTHEGAGATLTDEDVAQASADVRVEFGAVRTSKGRGNIYETRVINKGSAPIRITHFGAYSKRGETWTLNTIVEGFFTAEQFREWYGAAGDGWLAPGASGADRENYGADCLWVYFYETREGQMGKAIGRAPK